ncbi:MAG: hypothetical protein ACRCVK_11300 [Aeromonas veronii]
MSESIVKVAAASIFGAIADQGTYQAPNAEPIDVRLFVHRDIEVAGENAIGAPVFYRRTEISIIRADLPAGRPPRGGRIVLGDESWVVDVVVEMNSTAVRMAVK